MTKFAIATRDLPAEESLSTRAQSALNIAKSLPDAELTDLLGLLSERLRQNGLEASAEIELVPGDLVEIIAGSPKFRGRIARVLRSKRARCYVSVEGHDAEVYLFKSDVKKIAPVTQEKVLTGTLLLAA